MAREALSDRWWRIKCRLLTHRWKNSKRIRLYLVRDFAEWLDDHGLITPTSPQDRRSVGQLVEEWRTSRHRSPATRALGR